MNENEAASTRATSRAQWLTVSEAAARLGVSERTVQRRCKSGKLPARLETGADGAAWLIDGATLPPFVATGAANVPTGADTAFKSESAPDGNAAPPSVATLPTGADTLPPSVATDESGVLLAHLQGENAFLRGLIEQRDRDAAELRAALRKALEAMPKQLEAREYSQGDGAKLEQVGTGSDGAHNAAQATKSGAAGKVSGATKTGGKPHKLAAWQRVAARVLGIR